MDLRCLWNETFASKQDAELGWYESDFSPSQRLLEHVSLAGARVFVAGAGTSGLVDWLHDQGAQLHLNDLSETALVQLRQRLGKAAQSCDFEVADLGKPWDQHLPTFDLWVDRAVLHFLCEDAQVQAYFERLKSQLAAGGYVLLAEFAPGGASKCNGLPIRQWSVLQMQEALGDTFVLRQHFDHVFLNPRGEPRPYTYALFQRINE